MGLFDFIFGYCYKNKKGEKFWLHRKIGRGGNVIYYFSKEPAGAIALPPGYVVVENPRTGLPVLKKIK